MEPKLKERESLRPRDFIAEAMPDQPDELAAQCVGVTDHFLGGHAFILRGDRATFLCFIQNFLVGASDVLHTGEQNGE